MAKAGLISWLLQEAKKPPSDTIEADFFLRRELQDLSHI